jgi:hypothetical protein
VKQILDNTRAAPELLVADMLTKGSGYIVSNRIRPSAARH